MTADTTSANFCFGIMNGRGKQQGLRDDSDLTCAFGIFESSTLGNSQALGIRL